MTQVVQLVLKKTSKLLISKGISIYRSIQVYNNNKTNQFFAHWWYNYNVIYSSDLNWNANPRSGWCIWHMTDPVSFLWTKQNRYGRHISMSVTFERALLVLDVCARAWRMIALWLLCLFTLLPIVLMPFLLSISIVTFSLNFAKTF